MILYGLKNCDSCRKAVKWLDGQGIDHRFHDVRKDGLDRGMIESFMSKSDWETLVNRKSKTWRELPEAKRINTDSHNAVQLIQEFPTLLKRPVLDGRGIFAVGFSVERYEDLLLP